MYRQCTETLIQEGKWQPSFQDIIENVIGNCATCLPKRVRSAKPHGTLPKAMDFNDIISVDLKELQPEYRKEGYRYILYIVDKFSKEGRPYQRQGGRYNGNGIVYTLENRKKW